MSLIKKNGIKRWSPSYLRNRGHLSKKQRKCLRDLWPKYGITLQYGHQIELPSLWDSKQPLVLEIGFGQGEHLLSRAQINKDSNFIGVEVHKPAIANVLNLIETENIRIVRADALVLLHDYMPQKSLSEVCIFFPEPWSDHNKHRRIVNPNFLSILEPLLQKDANFYFATDVREYATYVLEVFQNSRKWSLTSNSNSERPAWRPLSKYEKKGLLEGRRIYDLHWNFTAAN